MMRILKNILKQFNKTPEPKYAVLGPNDVYYHEDLFCQVEFSPRENVQRLEEENLKIRAFADEHFDGNGYTDIYVRKEKYISISDKKIPLIEIDEFLKSLGMVRAEKVYYGYGSGYWICDNTYAYILHEAKIFVDFKEDVVTSFWIDNFKFHQSETVISDLKQIMIHIGEKFEVVPNDSDLLVTVDLLDEINVDMYLNERLVE